MQRSEGRWVIFIILISWMSMVSNTAAVGSWDIWRFLIPGDSIDIIKCVEYPDNYSENNKNGFWKRENFCQKMHCLRKFPKSLNHLHCDIQTGHCIQCAMICDTWYDIYTPVHWPDHLGKSNHCSFTILYLWIK